MSRRKLLMAGLFVLPVAALAGDSMLLEPQWLKVKSLPLSRSLGCRLAHFTDVHYKGDRAYLQRVVEKINEAKPDLVCFTGDLVEEDGHLDEALELLGKIQAPMYGVPGNHDFWAKVDFDKFRRAFARQGGAWLHNDTATVFRGKIKLHGVAQIRKYQPAPQPGVTNILLAHYPAWADDLEDKKFDLILAGHTHGGQVRIPGYGPLVIPYESEEYDYGLFQSKGGPLYVSSGIGYFMLNVRFNCRPEVVVIEL